MKCSRVDFHQRAGGDQESFYLCCIQKTVCDLVLSGKEQNKLLCAQVEFTVAVILQTVQCAVVSAAPEVPYGPPALFFSFRIRKSLEAIRIACYHKNVSFAAIC